MLIITNDNCSNIILSKNYHHSAIYNNHQLWGKMKDVYLTTGASVNSAIDPAATEFIRQFTPPPA